MRGMKYYLLNALFFITHILLFFNCLSNNTLVPIIAFWMAVASCVLCKKLTKSLKEENNND